MAPKGMKRPAAAPAVLAPNKKPASGAKMCGIVTNAIVQSADYPEAVKSMVAASLPSCFSAPKEARHPMQEEVIDMASKVFESIAAAHQKDVEAAKVRSEKVASEMAAKDAAVEAAAATATEKATDTETKKAALAKSAEALTTANAALAEAQGQQKKSTAELEASKGKKEKLETTLSGSLEPLKAGTMEPKAVTGAVAAVVSLGKEIQLEPSLMGSLSSAIGKVPADRGTFDTLVLQQLDERIASADAALTEAISTGEAALGELATSVLAGEATASTASEAEKAAKAALAEATAAQKEAEAAVKAATKVAKDFVSEVKAAEKSLTHATGALESFEQGAMKAFQELIEFTLIPPVEKAAPKVEAAPAEGEPVAAPVVQEEPAA